MTSSPRPAPVFHEQQDGLPMRVDSDPEVDHRAKLFVCDQAIDVADARELLAMLGLIEAPPPVAPVVEPKPGPDKRMDARIAALAAQGLPAQAIAERLGVQVRRIALWRKRQREEEEGREGCAPRCVTGEVEK